MAKTGGWCKKLMDKSKSNASHLKLGRQRALIARPPAKASTYHDKLVALEAHKRAIHGLVIRGVVVEEGGRNPAPAECFAGDGLPDDSLAATKPPKTNAERAKADKRNPLKHEMRNGWKPERFTREVTFVERALAAL
jgi:hypothetical protein